MRRHLAALAVAGLTVVSLPAAASAVAPGQQDAGRRARCTVSDGRVTELSGMASDGKNLYVINDGGDEVRVFVLDSDCAVRGVVESGLDPYDPEDLARSGDGTLWLADTGDNSHRRRTVALIAVTPSGHATLYRLTYPDGAHDAEALLLAQGGMPYLVTKNPLGRSGVYRPARSLTSPGPTPLRKVGSVSVGPTDTPGGPLPAEFGSVLVTGGAVSADGTVVALRTYTDAYLYPAPDGDVAAALRRTPERIPLPGERQGEAIAFEPDGTLLSAGEGEGQPVAAVADAAARVRAGDGAGRSSGADGTSRSRTGSRHEVHAAGTGQDRGEFWWYVGGGAVVLAGIALLGYRVRRRFRRS